MRATQLALVGLFFAGWALSQHVNAAANDPVATIDPACPEWKKSTTPGQWMLPPTITIRYNTKSPGARLKSPQALNVILASGTVSGPFHSVTIPMASSGNGLWQADFTPKKLNLAAYDMFFFEDDKNRVDNNRSQYWEILYCSDSQVSELTIQTQASTYEGRLLAPGFQRQPDLARAIQILKADIEARPSGSVLYAPLWRLELQQGGNSPAAYEQLGKEIEAFLSAHSNDLLALRQVAGFIAVNQSKLPPDLIQRFRAALIDLPETADPFQINSVTKEIIHIPRDARFIRGVQQEVTRYLSELDYWSINPGGQNACNKMDQYLAFAEKYPDSNDASFAYQTAFSCYKEANNIAGAEIVFEKLMASKPPQMFPLLNLAKLYIDKKIKLTRALELVDTAEKMYLDSEAPGSSRHFRMEPGEIESLRGQAHRLLNDLATARADFEAAFKAAPGNPTIAYALGQTCEQMGDNKRALEAYLAAATAPYQEGPDAHEAYERLFVAQKLGDKQDAEQRLADGVAARTRAAAAEYTPVPVNRPAPDFAFTDLAGKRLDNETTKGKPSVLTFWGIWCVPCIAELPSIHEFQKQHPGANVISVEIGDKPDQVKAFLAAHNLNGLHVALQRDWPEAFGAGQTPMTVVMDRFGQIQFVHVGLLANVDAILGKDLAALPEAQ